MLNQSRWISRRHVSFTSWLSTSLPYEFPLPVQLLYYWATEKITEKLLIELFSSNKLVLVTVIVTAKRCLLNLFWFPHA